jgi:hypothetical protein
MSKPKTEMSPLTEGQFHTVWTEATGKPGYDKKLFQEVLKSLKAKHLILPSPPSSIPK